MSQVLQKELGVDVLPEAIAVLESSRSKLWTRRPMQDFIFQHLHLQKNLVKSQSLTEALSICQLHSRMQHFAADFAVKSLVLQGG